jgi:hypothetical protein
LSDSDKKEEDKISTVEFGEERERGWWGRVCVCVCEELETELA